MQHRALRSYSAWRRADASCKSMFLQCYPSFYGEQR
jgi:hypothetical protein